MRGTWDRRRVTAIAIGGAAGAAMRWAVVTPVEADPFPWAVLALNIVGSLLLGVLLAEEWAHPGARLLLHDVGAIGFCGGLTTFSTFSLEVVSLVRDDDAWLAALYAAASVVTSIVSVIVGAAALQRVRAVSLPLEELP